MKTMKKDKTAKAQYVAEVQIVATISSGEKEGVTLKCRPPRNATEEESALIHMDHAIFSLAESNGFQRGLAEKILHMARASRRVKYYRFQRRPSEKEVALQYLYEIYPGQTQHLERIQSCYSPTGWIWPPPKDEQCVSFAFFEPDLHIVCNGKNLILRFCVSVNVKEVASS